MAKRKSISPEEKVQIIRQHLVEKVLVSDLADQYGFQPTQFYQWQKQFFENGQAAFEKNGNSSKSKRDKKLEEENARLKAKITYKDEVIAEIIADHVRLKKSLGED